MIKDFGISFTAWNILNLIVMNLRLPDSHLKREDYLDMRNRIVSFFHGFMALFLAGYHTYFLHSECGLPNTRLEYLTAMNSCGYFAYDLVAMAYFGLLDRGMLLHHSMCVFGFAAAIIENTGLSFTLMGLFVAEVSNPIMHVRMVIKHLGKRYTKSYEYCEVTYICKFFSNIYLC